MKMGQFDFFILLNCGFLLRNDTAVICDVNSVKIMTRITFELNVIFLLNFINLFHLLKRTK